MTLDDLTRTALIRGATAFAVVLVVGSTAVYTSARLRGDSEGAASPTPVSPSPAQPPVTGTPEAWLAWVPGGLPDGFGASITAIPAIADTTTATADIAWLTGSSDARGRPVDQPVAPYMIPIDTTGVEPGFASFLPQPERRTGRGAQPAAGDPFGIRREAPTPRRRKHADVLDRGRRHDRRHLAGRADGGLRAPGRPCDRRSDRGHARAVRAVPGTSVCAPIGRTARSAVHPLSPDRCPLPGGRGSSPRGNEVPARE